jgi:hypothetical protein
MRLPDFRHDHQIAAVATRLSEAAAREWIAKDEMDALALRVHDVYRELTAVLVAPACKRGGRSARAARARSQGKLSSSRM